MVYLCKVFTPINLHFIFIRFDLAPRNFPATIGLQDFNCRKNFWAINCQVLLI